MFLIGRSWSIETSSVNKAAKTSRSGGGSGLKSDRSMKQSATYSDGFSSKSGSHGNSSSGGNQSYSSYQNGSEMPDLQSAEFKKDEDSFCKSASRQRRQTKLRNNTHHQWTFLLV